MSTENLSNSKGIRIVKIDCSEVDFTVERFSEIGDNWEIPAKCPTCERTLYFNKHNVNTLITCKCGQTIKVEIPDTLL